MSRPHRSSEAPDDNRSNDGPIVWSQTARIVASIAIAFHVSAVFIAPFASPPPASDLAQAMARVIQPYLKGVAIDNGYRFFAPEPAASHLVRYKIEKNDGTTVEGTFPDAERHWPRLLYHRHFMVAETLFNLAAPVAEIPPGGFPTDEQRALFDRERERADTLKYALAKYLFNLYPDGKRVQMLLVEHEIPPPWDLRDGLQLDDPRLYVESSIDVISRDDIERFEERLSPAGTTR